MRHVAAVLTSVLAVLAGTLAGTVPAHATTSGTLTLDHGPESAFSPNGDGVRDRQPLTLVTDRRAALTVTVLTATGTVVRGPVSLGTVAGGRHTWRWDGRTTSGRQAARGSYLVRARAVFTRTGKATRALATVTVDRSYWPGTLTASSTVVYPRSTEVHDAVTLTHATRESDPVRVLAVRDRTGSVVLRSRLDPTSTPTSTSVSWDGRDTAGHPLPAGAYTAQVTGYDPAGNRGATARLPLTVSAQSLVTRTKSVTVTPAASRVPACGQDAPDGCGDYPDCGTVVASDRFGAGALSYRSGASCAYTTRWRAGAVHHLAVAEPAPRGFVDYQVSMFGGPTRAGGTDQGRLYLPSGTGTAVSSSTGADTTDHTTALAAAPVPAGSKPGEADLRWVFETRERASYDIDVFTVRYRFLTPVS